MQCIVSRINRLDVGKQPQLLAWWADNEKKQLEYLRTWCSAFHLQRQSWWADHTNKPLGDQIYCLAHFRPKRYTRLRILSVRSFSSPLCFLEIARSFVFAAVRFGHGRHNSNQRQRGECWSGKGSPDINARLAMERTQKCLAFFLCLNLY
jgi:hypothetical protein